MPAETTGSTEMGREAPDWLDAVLPRVGRFGRMLFDPIWSERLHAGASFELNHIVRGEVCLSTESGEHRAGPGETIAVPPGTRHRDDFDLAEGLEVFMVFFRWRGEQLLIPAPEESGDGVVVYRDAELASAFDRLRIAGEGTVADDLLVRTRVLEILLLMRRRRERARGSVDGDEGGGARSELMQRVLVYLHAHYHQPLSLDVIAEAVGVSGYHLSHVFSRESDFTLSGYLTALRMDRARKLLADGEGTIAEVAEAVGYANGNYFAKAFRRHCGCSPSSYREQRR